MTKIREEEIGAVKIASIKVQRNLDPDLIRNHTDTTTKARETIREVHQEKREVRGQAVKGTREIIKMLKMKRKK